MSEQKEIVVFPPSSVDMAALPLLADLQFGELFTSEALNRKFHNIITHGIFEGFDYARAGGLNLTVCATGDQHTTTAKHQDFTLTIHAQFPVTLPIPAGQKSAVIVDSFYEYGVETTQVSTDATQEAAEYKVIPATSVLPHHVIIVEVDVPAGATSLTAAMFHEDNRSIGGIGILEHENKFNPHPQYAQIESVMANVASSIFSKAKIIKNAHWNMQLSERIRQLENNK